MPVQDVTEHIRFVVRRIADAITVAIGAGVVAPIVAAALFGKSVGPIPALLGFKWGLPHLVGVPDEGIPNKDILLGTVAQIKADVICGDDISFELILGSLLDEQATVLACNEVVQDSRVVELLENHAVTPIGKDEVAGHKRLPTEHQSRANGVPREGVAQQFIFVRIHVMNPETGFGNAVSSNDVGVCVRKVETVALIVDDVVDNTVPLRLPQVDAIAASGAGLRSPPGVSRSLPMRPSTCGIGRRSPL